MKRKLFSALLALAMMATLTLPAFAAAAGSGGASQETMNYAGSTSTPTVTVEMPESPAVILNPYGMSVTVGTGDDAPAYSGQIVSPVLYIKNQTQAAMKVGVKATATVAGNAQLSSKPCTGKETTLNAFLMVELAEVEDNDGAPKTPTWFVDSALSAEKINEKCYPQIIPTADGKTANALLSVSKPEIAENAVTPNYIAINVTGNLAGNPTGGWTSADTVTLKLEFTFTPGVANAVTAEEGVTTVTADPTASVMGAAVRLKATDKKQPVVTDGAGNSVTVNKVSDELYYFTMPATAVTFKAGT